MALSPSTFSFACKFCHYFPLCVADYRGQIIYVMHRLPLIIITTIHLKVHKRHVVDGNCREYVNKIIRLIVKEVDHTPDAKISVILLGASKTFLTMHLLDDSGDGIVELSNDEQLEQI
jgi:hypothetical protein